MNKTGLAPVLLFVYKRLDSLTVCIEALKKNTFARHSELFIFSDGAKTSKDAHEIRRIREYIRTIDGFMNIQIFESGTNKGLANSIINGVSQVIDVHGKVIVLEDDLLTSSNFLSFMNQCLDHYEDDAEVFSVSGYSYQLKKEIRQDVYFTKRGSSWGWATWKDRWKLIDWQVNDYYTFKKDALQKKAFNRMGSDLSSMLAKQMEGKMNSWAIRWVYHQFKRDLFTVYPTASKIKNIGFGDSATHTFDFFNRYETIVDDSGKESFNLVKPHIEPDILKGFLKKYSISTRVKYKALNMIASGLKKMFKRKTDQCE